MTTPKGKQLRSNSNAGSLLDVKKMISAVKDEIVEILMTQTEKINSNLNSISDRLEVLENNFSKIQTRQEEQEKEINYLKSSLKNLETRSSGANMTEVWNEIESRLDRKSNLVIQGVPEEVDGCPQSRQHHDEGQFLCLMNELNVQNTAFQSLRRIGKRTPNGHRLIKITGLEKEQKKEILRKSKTLRHSNTFKRVFIRPDMTPMEQQNFRSLQAELRERREKGEIVCIYNGEIRPRDFQQNFR